MSTGHHDRPVPYEIRIQGHLEPRWAAWFDGLGLRQESDGTTVLHGPVADQAALHGLLQRLRDLGLPLLSLTRAEAPDAPSDDPDRRPDPQDGHDPHQTERPRP